MLRRRSFTSLALATLATPLFAQEEPPALPVTIGPYLQNPTADSITVMLLTQGDGAMQVTYGDRQVAGHGVAIEGTTWFSWRATIKGLTPATKLSYRLVWQPQEGKGFTSDAYQVQCADPNATTTKFLVFNDVHNNTKVVEELVKQVEVDEYDFTLLIGDIWTDPSPANNAEKVFRTMVELVKHLQAATKPMLFVRGNHETRGGFKDRLAHFFDIPGLDAAKPHDEQEWWFTLRIGPLAMIAADTGEDGGVYTDPRSYKRPLFWQSYRKRHIPWLQENIQAESVVKAPWRIFVSHIPLYNPARWFCESGERDWLEYLKQLNLNFMLAGHDHGWKFIPADLTFEHHVGAPEGGVVLRRFTPPWPIMVGGGPSIKSGTVMKVGATTDKFELEMLNGEGRFLRAYEMYA